MITAIIFLILSLAAHSQTIYKPLTWQIKSSEWSRQDELNFQEFIRNIGKAREQKKCLTTEQCLKSTVANPLYAKLTNPQIKIFSDCADLPFILRAYFAWMNNLPFSYPTALKRVNPTRDQGKDIRYTSYGNEVVQRAIVKNGDLVSTVFKNIINFISSAAFRIPTTKDVTRGNVFNDFYPVKISRKSIVPGTVVYDPNGHVLVVYEVTSDGRIFMIDAHPDNSLTRAIYDDKKFVVSSPSYGAGFKNWRPFTVDSTGTHVARKNSELTDQFNFSAEQYLGHAGLVNNNWKTRKYLFKGEVVSFGEFVRQSLAEGNLRYNPLREFRESLKSLCDDIKDRKDAVDLAIKSKIHLLPQPEKLPDNIYGTTGTWETYSTPSRDARLKATLWNIKDSLVSFLNKYNSGDHSLDYNGGDLIRDLQAIYQEEAISCIITYKNSRGLDTQVTMDQVIERIYDLSFDPYHCIELRWGAKGEEAKSCTQDQIKNDWFLAQQNLRNTIERNYDLRMDYNLKDLSNAPVGVKSPIDLNFKKVIEL